MLAENSVLKLNKNLLKRYEPSIDDGVLFLFNVKTEELWTGNDSSNDLVKLIDGEKNLKEIYDYLIPTFEGYSSNEIKETFDIIITDLINKNFLEYAAK